MRKSKSSKLAPVLRAMDAFTAPAPAEPQWEQSYSIDDDGSDGDDNTYTACDTCGEDICLTDEQYVTWWGTDEDGQRVPVGYAHQACFDREQEEVEQARKSVTCHRCGAVVDGDALTVQTAADGTPKLDVFLCEKHMIAFAERLKAAIREQREGGE